MSEIINGSGLVSEIVEQGVWDKDGLLTDPAYRLVVESIPIVCVDVIPVNNEGAAPRLGVIVRATGPERGKAALLGGRVMKNELISTAIGRHLLGSLGSEDFAYHEGNSEDEPFFVQQYLHQDSAEAPCGYDPTKHAIAMTYLIDIDKPRYIRDEASDFRWVYAEEIPEESAYNHHVAMLKAEDFLQRLP